MVIEYIGTIIRNEVANRKEKLYESQVLYKLTTNRHLTSIAMCVQLWAEAIAVDSYMLLSLPFTIIFCSWCYLPICRLIPPALQNPFWCSHWPTSNASAVFGRVHRNDQGSGQHRLWVEVKELQITMMIACLLFRTEVCTCSAWTMTTWLMLHSQEGLQGEAGPPLVQKTLLV